MQCPRESDEARTCLKEVWGAALAPVSSRNSSQLKSVSSMLEPSSVQKKEKKKKRKKNSLKHSQRRQKLCQRVQGENSNQYKHQHKGKQKACFKDLCLLVLTGSYYTLSRLWDFSSQHRESRNDSAFMALGNKPVILQQALVLFYFVFDDCLAPREVAACPLSQRCNGLARAPKVGHPALLITAAS